MAWMKWEFDSPRLHQGRLAQLARASRLHRGGRGFESLSAHHSFLRIPGVQLPRSINLQFNYGASTWLTTANVFTSSYFGVVVKRYNRSFAMTNSEFNSPRLHH